MNAKYLIDGRKYQINEGRLEYEIQPNTWQEINLFESPEMTLAMQLVTDERRESEIDFAKIVEDFDLPFDADLLERAFNLYDAIGEYVTLTMTKEDAIACAQRGPDSGDENERNVCIWIVNNRTQMDKHHAHSMRLQCQETGAWDAQELQDEEQNEMRVVWMAACDIREENQF